jgi:hypothetical protein
VIEEAEEAEGAAEDEKGEIDGQRMRGGKGEAEEEEGKDDGLAEKIREEGTKGYNRG